MYRVSDKKGIDKKHLVIAAHGFSSQFLNLSEFSISVVFFLNSRFLFIRL